MRRALKPITRYYRPVSIEESIDFEKLPSLWEAIDDAKAAAHEFRKAVEAVSGASEIR